MTVRLPGQIIVVRNCKVVQVSAGVGNVIVSCECCCADEGAAQAGEVAPDRIGTQGAECDYVVDVQSRISGNAVELGVSGLRPDLKNVFGADGNAVFGLSKGTGRNTVAPSMNCYNEGRGNGNAVIAVFSSGGVRGGRNEVVAL